MTLVEPASSLTDFALGMLALMIAGMLRPTQTGDADWRWFFVWIGIAGLWGGFNDDFIVGHETAAAFSWPAISLIVAVAISYLLAASVNTVSARATRGQALRRDPNVAVPV